MNEPTDEQVEAFIKRYEEFSKELKTRFTPDELLLGKALVVGQIAIRAMKDEKEAARLGAQIILEIGLATTMARVKAERVTEYADLVLEFVFSDIVETQVEEGSALNVAKQVIHAIAITGGSK